MRTDTLGVAGTEEKLALRNVASPRLPVCLGVLTGMLLMLYAPVLRDLVELWWGRDDYSHGFLILPLSIFLAWTRRETLCRLPPKPVLPLGVALTLSAGLLLVVGQAAGVLTATALSLIGMIAGIVLLLFGATFLRIAALPIGYLLFMIPVLDTVVEPLQWPSQLLTARMAVNALDLLRVPALLDQQYIVLPHVTLEVARVCSGANYLVSVAAVGLMLGWVSLRTWWSRATLLCGGLIMSVAANWARVVLISLWSYAGGSALHGPFHVLQGMFVAWVGYAVLFAGTVGLARLESRMPGTLSAIAMVEGPPTRRYTGEWYRAWWIAMLTISVLAGYLFFWGGGPVALKSNFSTFPSDLGDWHQVAADDPPIFRLAGADDELMRTYRNERNRTMRLYVAHLRSQRQGHEVVDYRTAPLHEGAVAVDIQLAPDHIVRVNRGYVQDGEKQRRTFFWYELNGRTIPDRYEAKLATMWQAIFRGRSHGAFVLVAEDAAAPGDAGLESAEHAFIRDVVQALEGYLP